MRDSNPHAMKVLDRLKCHSRLISYSSSDNEPGALLSNENAEGFLQLLLSFRNSAPSVTTNENAEGFLQLLLSFRNSAPSVTTSRADEVAPRGIESQKYLQRPAPRASIVPPASSVANGMLTLEQQLASLNEELQRRHINHQLAFSIEQQQGTRQGSLHAKNFVLDKMPSIEQQPPSLTDEQLDNRGSYQAPSDQNRGAFSIEEQLASLIEQHRLNRAPIQDRKPTIKQQPASLNRPASTSPACHLPPNLLAGQHQTSHVTSLERLQLLVQLQRGIVPHAQPEIQAPSGPYSFRNVDQGHLMDSLPSRVPTEGPLPVPPPFGPREPFPGKLYRLLAEAERNGNARIVSFTPDGCAFKIHSRERFITEVSPAHFSQAKITSFVRQLNFYGFEKLLDGPNRGAFGHPYFRRGYPELLLMIERKLVATRPKKDRGRRNVVAPRPKVIAARVKKDRGRGRSE
jgi:hypothetical protein